MPTFFRNRRVAGRKGHAGFCLRFAAPPEVELPVVMPLLSLQEPAMSVPGDSQVSAVLQAAQSGDRQAAADLLPLVYEELHQLAHAVGTPAARPDPATDGAGERGVPAHRRREQRHLGRPAALFLRRSASHARHLVEQARRKAGPKRGGDRRRQELDEACAVLKPPSDDVLAIHEALEELEARDSLKAQIVLLRYFTGLTMGETAAVLGLPERTLGRHWRYIRAWLMKRLS